MRDCSKFQVAGGGYSPLATCFLEGFTMNVYDETSTEIYYHVSTDSGRVSTHKYIKDADVEFDDLRRDGLNAVIVKETETTTINRRTEHIKRDIK